MKVAAIALSLLLLVGCTNGASRAKFSPGIVTNCGSIVFDTSKTEGTYLECLDGSVGGAIENIKGPAVLNVWGSWCASCREELKYFRNFKKIIKDKVLLLGVDVEEKNIEAGRRFTVKNGITWPSLYDPDGRTRAIFGMGVPVTWFITADGKVAYKKIGPIKNELELATLTSKYLGIKF